MNIEIISFLSILFTKFNIVNNLILVAFKKKNICNNIPTKIRANLAFKNSVNPIVIDR